MTCTAGKPLCCNTFPAKTRASGLWALTGSNRRPLPCKGASGRFGDLVVRLETVREQGVSVFATSRQFPLFLTLVWGWCGVESRQATMCGSRLSHDSTITRLDGCVWRFLRVFPAHRLRAGWGLRR